MKLIKLSKEEFSKAPVIIQYLVTMEADSIPVSNRTRKDAQDIYPEYFMDETEYKLAWAKIPQEVHDEFIARKKQVREDIFRGVPPIHSDLFYSGNEDAYLEWKMKFEECTEKLKPLMKELFEKTYSPYGITEEL